MSTARIKVPSGGTVAPPAPSMVLSQVIAESPMPWTSATQRHGSPGRQAFRSYASNRPAWTRRTPPSLKAARRSAMCVWNGANAVVTANAATANSNPSSPATTARFIRP